MTVHVEGYHSVLRRSIIPREWKSSGGVLRDSRFLILSEGRGDCPVLEPIPAVWHRHPDQVPRGSAGPCPRKSEKILSCRESRNVREFRRIGQHDRTNDMAVELQPRRNAVSNGRARHFASPLGRAEATERVTPLFNGSSKIRFALRSHPLWPSWRFRPCGLCGRHAWRSSSLAAWA